MIMDACHVRESVGIQRDQPAAPVTNFYAAIHHHCLNLVLQTAQASLLNAGIQAINQSGGAVMVGGGGHGLQTHADQRAFCNRFRLIQQKPLALHALKMQHV